MSDVRVDMNQVFKAVQYANDHPDRYLSGTTNWCAAVAFALNRLIINAQPSDGALTNDLNQCDGCRAGKPLENGNRHRMGKEGGYPDFMSCTAKLYTPAPTNQGAEPVAQRQYLSRGEFPRWMNLFDDEALTHAKAEGFETRLLFLKTPASTESRS